MGGKISTLIFEMPTMAASPRHAISPKMNNHQQTSASALLTSIIISISISTWKWATVCSMKRIIRKPMPTVNWAEMITMMLFIGADAMETMTVTEMMLMTMRMLMRTLMIGTCATGYSRFALSITPSKTSSTLGKNF